MRKWLFSKSNALSNGGIAEHTVKVKLNQITLKKADLHHLETAGSLVKEGGIIIHKIQWIKPATSWSGFSHSLTPLLLTGNPDTAEENAATRMKCE